MTNYYIMQEKIPYTTQYIHELLHQPFILKEHQVYPDFSHDTTHHEPYTYTILDITTNQQYIFTF